VELGAMVSTSVGPGSRGGGKKATAMALHRGALARSFLLVGRRRRRGGSGSLNQELGRLCPNDCLTSIVLACIVVAVVVGSWCVVPARCSEAP